MAKVIKCDHISGPTIQFEFGWQYEHSKFWKGYKFSEFYKGYIVSDTRYAAGGSGGAQ